MSRQSGSDLTGFTRNFFLNGCDVRTLQRIALRHTISRPAGFLSDLLLRSKKSAGREGTDDGEKDESSFHCRLICCRLVAGKLYHRPGDCGTSFR
jgi:hypothetical protein